MGEAIDADAALERYRQQLKDQIAHARRHLETLLDRHGLTHDRAIRCALLDLAIDFEVEDVGIECAADLIQLAFRRLTRGQVN